MRGRLRLLGLLALATAAVRLPAAAAEPVVIRFSHVVAVDTPKGKAAEYFRRLVEARGGGRVRVEVYPNGQLYGDRDELEALQLGAVQMLAPSLAKFGPLGVREFEVFDLPYLFDDTPALHRVTDGPIGRRLLDRLESRGIRGLAFWDNGFKHFSANRPIRRPEDLRGLRMRIQASRVLDEQMRALGALPRAMDFSEVYPALKSGVIDGTENPVSNLYTQRMHEVQKHLTLTGHGTLGYAVIVNRRFWDGLPGDVRQLLEAAIDDATRYANRIAREENDRALDAVRASGKTRVYVPTADERAAFRRALLPVHRAMAGRIGSDLIAAIYREIDFDTRSR